MSVRRLLSAWRAEPTIAGNIEDWRSISARPARTIQIPGELHPLLAEALSEGGIQSLYLHQAACWEKAKAGENIVVVSSTASGKTLCYNLPVLDRLIRDSKARALYIFPTKALAQDQLEALRRIRPNEEQLPTAIYDGDTPAHNRPAIRNNARLLLTNPDMLHLGILPHHTSWAEFFSSLQFVILDEIHTYRGVFGSHVANVLRRLQRISRFYGGQPQFIMTSATIANPEELAYKLIEQKVNLIDQDGSASGPKTFLIYNPPIIDPDLGLRRSSLQESVRLAEDLLAYDLQTIVFARSRRSVELVLSYLRERALYLNDSLDPPQGSFEKEIKTQLRGYRSGYLPAERREIERGLREGDVRVVVATNALELGIDIGGMAASVMVGYPGSIAATWQQAGRAGRGEMPSLVILVTTAAPLDQFLASHPDYFFGRSPEHALINPDNLLILLDHLRCAAFELPFQEDERYGELDANTLIEFLDLLVNDGLLYRSGQKYFWMADQYPAQRTSLRNASANPVVLQITDQDRAITIGQVDQSSALWMVHPEAIYMHEGRTYIVEDLALDENIAHMRPIQTDYYTTPRRETTVELVEIFGQSEVHGGAKAHGEVLVRSQVTGFQKIRWYTHERLGIGELDLPPTELLTTGYWLALSDESVAKLDEKGLWRNAPNNYGPNWGSQRQLARQRDGFVCQVCGAAEDEHAHDVHHKIPFRAFLTGQQANQLGNLITLCHACHLRVETAVRVRSGLAGVAFVLHHLAPLFLMCDSGDLGVHSDPKSPITEGRPSVILYDQVPAGIGLSQHLFESHHEILTRARELVIACECIDGCPSCVGPGGEAGLGGKLESLAILKALT